MGLQASERSRSIHSTYGIHGTSAITKGYASVQFLVKETLKGLGLNPSKLKVVTQSPVFEENRGAIVVSSSPRLIPTSNFIPAIIGCLLSPRSNFQIQF